MTFETIIRPFAVPTPLATRVVPVVVTQVATERASISWGKAGSGSLPVPQALTPLATPGSAGSDNSTGGDSNSAGFSFQIQNCNRKSQEYARQTVTQRITNPNDKTQFVDVQMPSKISFTMKPQANILESGFGGPTTTFADNDELYSIIEAIVDPPQQADTCNEIFYFDLSGGVTDTPQSPSPTSTPKPITGPPGG